MTCDTISLALLRGSAEHLYDEGQKRAGCIMCPLSCREARVRDYQSYPAHVRAIEMAVADFLRERERERERESQVSLNGETTHTKSSITGCTILLLNQQKALAYQPSLEVM